MRLLGFEFDIVYKLMISNMVINALLRQPYVDKIALVSLYDID